MTSQPLPGQVTWAVTGREAAAGSRELAGFGERCVTAGGSRGLLGCEGATGALPGHVAALPSREVLGEPGVT